MALSKDTPNQANYNLRPSLVMGNLREAIRNISMMERLSLIFHTNKARRLDPIHYIFNLVVLWKKANTANPNTITPVSGAPISRTGKSNSRAISKTSSLMDLIPNIMRMDRSSAKSTF
jgi:hypothetical protein